MRPETRPSSTIRHHTGSSDLFFSTAGKCASAEAATHVVLGTDEEATATQITAVVEAKTLQEMKLFFRSMQGYSVCASHSNPCEVTRAQADDMLLTTSRDQIQVHQPWCSCYRSLTTEFRRSGGADGERGAHSHSHADGFSLPAPSIPHSQSRDRFGRAE